MRSPTDAIPRLEVRGVSKAFGLNRVLRELELTVLPGEVHALIGGNGAGKSTLSKIIAGMERADAGELRIDGERYEAGTRMAAQARGITMVLQELNVLPTLSVAENLFLSDLPARGGILKRRALHEAARTALSRVGLERLDPAELAGGLGVGRQQLIEIAAGLARHCRLLILDEPTAALTGAERDTLFGLVRQMKAKGTSVLYISHRLEELSQLADRVSVLRDGRLVATLPVADSSREQWIALMAGRPASERVVAESTRPRRGTAEVTLELRQVSALPVVRDVSLRVHAGEVVGLGGLVGAGRTELLRAIFGASRISSGEMRLRGAPFRPRSTRESVRRGIAFVPEDRKQQGIFAPLSLRFNASLPQLPARGGLPGWIDRAGEETATRRMLTDLQVRHANAEQPIAQLSGGNQQKIVVGRWLRRDARLWLLDEPTRGVDVGAREGIHTLLRKLATDGAAVLVASSDYEELVALCGRVIVMSNGRIAGEFSAGELTTEKFTAAAFSGFAE